MKLPSLFPVKKLRATTARRSLGVADEMDYEEMSEPNMKLSRALLIVLVLHVVAVAGIIAFNTIKSRQVVVPPVSTPKSSVQTSAPKSTAPTITSSAPAVKPRDETATTKPAVKEERKAIPVKLVAESPKTDNKKTYVVAKGDTPLSIAKKFKVPFDDLLAVNKIDDPHKLKIGQKLIVPVKATKPKKSE
jgi:LysM repeat protein